MRPALILLLTFIVASPRVAEANFAGIASQSGKQGTFRSECHSGGATPVVRFEGPREVATGAIATFRFVIQSQAPAQGFAGFGVAASAGTLAATLNQGERILSGELTHSTPKENDSEGSASFEFTWAAPTALGSQTLFGAGNSVNLDLSDHGDAAAATTFVVNVVDVPTCSGDCLNDGEVTVEDLVLVVNIAGNPAQIAACDAADTNHDQRIDFAEIIAALDVALAGGAP